MEKNDVQEHQIEQCKQEAHPVCHLRANRASCGCKDQGRHGKEEGRRQGGDFTDVVHLDGKSLLTGWRKFVPILLNIMNFRNTKSKLVTFLFTTCKVGEIPNGRLQIFPLSWKHLIHSFYK